MFNFTLSINNFNSSLYQLFIFLVNYINTSNPIICTFYKGSFNIFIAFLNFYLLFIFLANYINTSNPIICTFYKDSFNIFYFLSKFIFLTYLININNCFSKFQIYYQSLPITLIIFNLSKINSIVILKNYVNA